ncbi:hypothetical protein E4T56_gene465 [Termitomyces sp. T112]|nr:hypothetical protein E4T56_gene465 [Termitomyces sp. T112]
MDLHETNPPTLTSAPLMSMPLHPVPMPQFPHGSPQVLGCPNHPFLLTILVPHPLQCLTLLPTPIISDPPPRKDPLDGPWGPPWAMWANPPARKNRNNYYYYYNAGPPPQAQNPQDNTCNALAWEVYGKQVSGLGLEDALDCRPDPNVFSALATLLCTIILAPDSPPVHLPSHSSTNLLLYTTLPFTDNSVPTLVNSGTTNNFIDESLAALTPHPLQCFPASILLKPFDGDPTPAGDITHCLEMTMTFTNE